MPLKAENLIALAILASVLMVNTKTPQTFAKAVTLNALHATDRFQRIVYHAILAQTTGT